LSGEPFASGRPDRFSARSPKHVKKYGWGMPFPAWSYIGWGTIALCAVAASVLAAPGLSGILGGALAVVMIAIAAIDARRFTIPNELVLAGLVLGFVEAPINHTEFVTTALFGSAWRSVALALLFLGFRTAYRLVRGREGIGLGDVKLAAVAGAWLGWPRWHLRST